MRSMFRSVLLALVAVLAVSAVAAASASAEAEWLLNEKPVTESTPVTISESPEVKFTLTDRTPPGGEISIQCSGVSVKGTVAPKGAGTITEFKVTKCTRIKQGGCKKQTQAEEESKEWVKAISLPWTTLIEGSGDFGQYGNGWTVLNWEFECETFIGTKYKDKCHAPRDYSDLDTVVGGVEQQIPAEPGFANFYCRLEGEETDRKAEVRANLIIKGPEGKTLSFK